MIINILAMGNSQDMRVFGVYMRWVFSMLETPITMWGFTFTVLDWVYGSVVATMIIGFMIGLVEKILGEHGVTLRMSRNGGYGE